MEKNPKPHKVLVVYWGNRGGGARLAHNLFLSSLDFEIPIFFSFSKNSEGGLDNFFQHDRVRPFLIQSPQRYFMNLNLVSAFASVGRIMRLINKLSITRVVMLMPHPWDFFLELLLKRSNIQVLRCMHDAKPHPGDKLIPNWYVRRLAKTSTVNIFFSDAVKKEFSYLEKKSISLRLFETKINDAIKRDTSRVLFVGRVKKYKGLPLLAAAWELIHSSELTLRISGSGKGIPRFLRDHSDVENKWLSDDELNNEIAGAKMIVLPYLEASQSGLIPIARASGTIIVCTPLEGLVEQLTDRDTYVISDDFTAKAFAAAILKANLLHNYNPTQTSDEGKRMLNSFCYDFVE